VKTIAEAQDELMPWFTPIGRTRLPLLRALGCVLADPVTSDRDLPGFDNSAMDGYAVRHDELREGRVVPVAGESRAGGGAPAPLPEGAAMRIFTGAPLPDGADTVVMQENARRSADGVAFDPLPVRGLNVRKRGGDLRRGALALSPGAPLGPGEIGLLAALGQHAVSVYRAPRVAIVSVGDELREIGADTEPGTVINSNAYALAAQVRLLGCEPWILPSAPDRLEDIVATLEQALRADVVITSGGVSVGDYDLVAEAFAQAGVRTCFAKVAIKPGKPFWFGVRERVPVVGLPGNPISSVVTFELFVRPALRRMLGHTAPYPSLIEVQLEHAHRHATGRAELARAQRLPDGGGDRPRVRLHALQGSGSLPSLVGADVLVVLAADCERFEAGAILPALPLRPERYQAERAFR
jgi:molybdopterin molybdotransferase